MEVEICPGEYIPVSEEKHWRGFVRFEPRPTVHWTTQARYTSLPRMVTRRGIYAMTKLACRARGDMNKPAWQRLYEECMAALAMQYRFGFRYAPGTFDDDKARLRFLLRDPQDRQDDELAQLAWRWAEKRYD